MIRKCGDDCQKSLSKDNLLLQGNVCIAFLHESSVPYKCLLLSRGDVCCKKKREKIFAVLAKIAHWLTKHFPCLFGKWLYSKILECRCLKVSGDNLLPVYCIIFSSMPRFIPKGYNMVFGCLTDKLCNLLNAQWGKIIYYCFFTVLTCIIFQTDILYVTSIIPLAGTYLVDTIQ